MIAHVVLNVSKYKDSKAFYDGLMELLEYSVALELEGDWGATTSYKNGEHNLWIKYEAKHQHLPFVRDVGLDHLAFKAASEEHVDQVHKYVQEKGMQITRDPRNYPEYNEPYYATYFRDPDGIPLEVVYK